MRIALLLALLWCSAAFAAAQPSFDHSHAAWTELLRRHVALLDRGKASQVDYAGFARDRPALKAYLEALSAVDAREYGSWTRAEQLAFLINAYNAFTIDIVLRGYPNVKSIRDLGEGFLARGPWKDKAFTLLGNPQSLDGVEHDTIRKPGAFDEPRIHFAVNCASVGCPMLREEAYVAARLDTQLEEQTVRFLSDRSRNRYDAQQRVLEVSQIFDWYRQDFERGQRGFESLPKTLARYADLLADAESDRSAIRAGSVPIRHLGYDWTLNDVRRR
jgi:hypothetical protein